METEYKCFLTEQRALQLKLVPHNSPEISIKLTIFVLNIRTPVREIVWLQRSIISLALYLN